VAEPAGAFCFAGIIYARSYQKQGNICIINDFPGVIASLKHSYFLLLK
jgi:hypothetical protein